jgi:uncharacterized membrane protein
MYPDSFIYFGVLHGIAVMLLLVRLLAPMANRLAPRGLGCAALGLLVIATHLLAGNAIAAGFSSQFGINLDARSLNWIGLITRLPVTEDYVPLFPWLGVMLLGFAGMQAYLRKPASLPARPAALAPAGWLPRGLAVLGRYSLVYYLVHQPVLLGLLWLAGVS